MKHVWKILGFVGIVVIVIFAGGRGKLVGKSTSERFFEGKKEIEFNSGS